MHLQQSVPCAPCLYTYCVQAGGIAALRRGLIYLPRCIANFTTNLLYSLQVQWICTVLLKAPAKSLLLRSQDKWGYVPVTLQLLEAEKEQEQEQQQLLGRHGAAARSLRAVPR